MRWIRSRIRRALNKCTKCGERAAEDMNLCLPCSLAEVGDDELEAALTALEVDRPVYFEENA